MQALYRRYRPKTFEEVVGQETTLTALQNQILENRIHHAYLFSGTRGTGKTSVAKIFARAVNCLHPVGASPCNACEVCRGILDETLFDVMEIDAASNNSVDDIREIREHVAYPPAVARKKVYIIDEVHMLSKGAFNALLKMLEEPPAHALFILATTEPEKIPATILSRSQRFTFLRLTEEEIAGELAAILKKENRAFTDEALSIIAEHSDGSMRDSLSILDQILSLSQDILDGDLVRKSLGLTDHEGIFRIVDGILASDAACMMDAVEDAYRGGKNIALLLDELIAYFRDLLFYRYAHATPKGLNEKEREIFTSQGEAMDEAIAFDVIELLQKGREDFRYVRRAKTAFEILLLKTLRRGEKNASDPAIHSREDRKAPEIAPPISKTEKRPPEGKHKPTPPRKTEEGGSLREQADRAIMKDDTVDDEAWGRFMESVREKNVACAALLKDVAQTEKSGETLRLLYDPSFAFHRKVLKGEENQRALNRAAAETFGDGWTVVVGETKKEDDPILESMKRVFKDTPIETD